MGQLLIQDSCYATRAPSFRLKPRRACREKGSRAPRRARWMHHGPETQLLSKVNCSFQFSPDGREPPDEREVEEKCCVPFTQVSPRASVLSVHNARDRVSEFRKQTIPFFPPRRKDLGFATPELPGSEAEFPEKYSAKQKWYVRGAQATR